MLRFLCCFCFVFHQVYFFFPASHLPWSHLLTLPLSLLIPLSSPPLLPCVMDVMIVLPRLTIILRCGGHRSNPWCSHGWRVLSQCEMNDLGPPLPPLWGLWTQTAGCAHRCSHYSWNQINFLSSTPSWYICIVLLTSLYSCHYSQQCVETWAVFALSFSAFYSLLSLCMWACVRGAADSGQTVIFTHTSPPPPHHHCV